MMADVIAPNAEVLASERLGGRDGGNETVGVAPHIPVMQNNNNFIKKCARNRLRECLSNARVTHHLIFLAPT